MITRVRFIFFMLCGLLLAQHGEAQNKRRKNLDPDARHERFEIRVIKPKYFKKKNRFELGAQLTTVMDNAFVYGFMATGLASFHFSESFALEASGSYGFSLQRSEKQILFDDFSIKTEVFRVQYLMEGVLQYTPIYGKLQVPGGEFFYLDTYLSGGAGLTGVDWQYSDFCQDRTGTNETIPIPEDRVASYMTGIFGIGQRIYRDRASAFKWDIRYRVIQIDKADTECAMEPIEAGSAKRTNVTMQFGMSKFF